MPSDKAPEFLFYFFERCHFVCWVMVYLFFLRHFSFYVLFTLKEIINFNFIYFSFLFFFLFSIYTALQKYASHFFAFHFFPIILFLIFYFFSIQFNTFDFWSCCRFIFCPALLLCDCCCCWVVFPFVVNLAYLVLTVCRFKDHCHGYILCWRFVVVLFLIQETLLYVVVVFWFSCSTLLFWLFCTFAGLFFCFLLTSYLRVSLNSRRSAEEKKKGKLHFHFRSWRQALHHGMEEQNWLSLQLRKRKNWPKVPTIQK